MFPSNRKKLTKHSLTRKRSNILPTTQGVVWIVFGVIVVVLGSLLLMVLSIVTDSSHGYFRQENQHQFLEPGHHAVGKPLNTKSTPQTLEPSKAEDAIAQMRKDFRTRYGPEFAERIRTKGMERYGDLTRTAERLLRAAAQRRPLSLAFAGYSVTVGRGNFFSQSYPMVLGALLQPLLDQVLQLPVTVRNAAIGGIPSFPYGFCLHHFLGSAPDVVSWDYSMNEIGADNTAVLEAYIRHSQHAYAQTKPMLVALDNHAKRCDLLKQYTELGYLSGALCVRRAESLFSKDELYNFTNAKENGQSLPPGLQDWNEFGAPSGCPGRSSWHPKKKEHELIAWILAMDWVDALEEAVHIIETNSDWRTKYAAVDVSDDKSHSLTTPRFPKPLSKTIPDNSQNSAIDHLLYGHETTTSTTPSNSELEMHHVSCRTSFLPATDQNKILPNIVVSGLSPNITAENIMEVRSDEVYNQGWVLDVSTVERSTKVKVEKCGGLGYEDMKIALYGIPGSGPFRLWLPIDSQHVHQEHHGDHSHDDKESMLASHWLDSLILCEPNEKRSQKACKLDQDLELTVGGVSVPVSDLHMIRGAAEYLKRPTCVFVPIPPKAQLTSLSKLSPTTESGEARISGETRDRLLASVDHKLDDPFGLVLDVRTTSKEINRKDGACCLSHVAWELH